MENLTYTNLTYTIDDVDVDNKTTFISQLSQYCIFVDRNYPTKSILCGDFDADLKLDKLSKTLTCFDKNGKCIFTHTFIGECSLSNSCISTNAVTTTDSCSTTNKIRIITTQIKKIGKINYILTNNCDMVMMINEMENDKLNKIPRNIFEFLPQEMIEWLNSNNLTNNLTNNGIVITLTDILSRIDTISKECLTDKFIKEDKYSKLLRSKSQFPYLELFNTHMLPESIHNECCQNDFFKDQLLTFNNLFEQFEKCDDEEILDLGYEILNFWNTLYTDSILKPFFVHWFNMISNTIKQNPIDTIFTSINDYCTLIPSSIRN